MRIVHLADTQLGVRQYGFDLRREDFFAATKHVFDRAIALKADVISIGGDLFQYTRPDGETVDRLQKEIKKAHKAGIQVVGVEGNHDFASGHWLSVLGITPVFGDAPVECVGGINMFGFDWCHPNTLRERLEQMSEEFGEAGQRVDVLLLHTSIAEFAGFPGQYISMEEFAPLAKSVGLRCVLLGDIHDYHEAEVNGIRFINPGSVEYTAMNEVGEKVFSIVDITEDVVETAMEPIPTRPVVSVAVKTEDDLMEVRNQYKDRQPIVVVSYPKDSDLKQKVETILEGFIVRLVPMDQNSTVDLLMRTGEQQYERKGSMRLLTDCISTRYEPDSDEYMLILSLLENPDRTRDIVSEFACSKNIDIKTGLEVKR